MKELDIDSWSIKEYFYFFKGFEEPYFGFRVLINCSISYAKCKEREHSCFLYYLYQSVRAANEIDAFKYRIKDGKVYVCDQVNGSATINRPDGTIGFSYMRYHEDYASFAKLLLRRLNAQETAGDSVL